MNVELLKKILVPTLIVVGIAAVGKKASRKSRYYAPSVDDEDESEEDETPEEDIKEAV